jgi:hypothetical protein
LLSAAAFLTVVVSTACTRIGEAASSDGKAVSPTLPPCNLASSSCPGLLAVAPEDGANWKDINNAVKAIKTDAHDWAPGEPSLRRPKINGYFVQQADPVVHPHSRDAGFDLSALPATGAIVVAAMKFKNVSYPDSYYLAGANNSGTEAVVVVYRDGLNLPPATGGNVNDRYIAKWRLFEKDGSKARLRSTGYIRLCYENSPVPVDGAYARFQSCTGQETLMRLSNSLKIPLAIIRKVMLGISEEAIRRRISFAQARSAMIPAPGAAEPQLAFLQGVPAALRRPLLEGLAAWTEPEGSPLWISCGQGCCTVETEK